jgi:hypothetical protein
MQSQKHTPGPDNNSSMSVRYGFRKLNMSASGPKNEPALAGGRWLCGRTHAFTAVAI